MTSDNNNWMTDFKRGKNGKIVFEKRMLFVEMKNERGARFAPFKNKICFGVDLPLVATSSQMWREHFIITRAISSQV